MFHCKIDGDYVVLQQGEVRSICMRLTGSAVGALAYNMRDLYGNASRARANEQLIIRHLRELKAADPESFRRAFVFRSDWGEGALPTFLALVDAQRRLGFPVECSEIDRWTRYSSDPLLAQDYEPPAVVVLSLLSSGRLIFRKRIIANLEIPLWDIEHVFGTASTFILMTKSSKMIFSVEEGLSIERRPPRQRSGALRN